MVKSRTRNSKSGALTGYIVALGASAGGLKPINEFFEEMPEDSGMSFVVIQHLSPDHKSIMAEIVSKHTPMEVYEAQQNMLVEADCIYLLPSAHRMTIENGRLQLHEKRSSGSANDAIDFFFNSLAKERGKKAVGIILSGTGTDGTEGLKSIKDAGGTTIVQDPATAEFDGMPNNAIAAELADLVTAPQSMPSELVDLIAESPVLKSLRESKGDEEEVFKEIISLVNSTARHDFSSYKRPTIQRRLAKRMREKEINSLKEYKDYLSSDPKELKILSQEFLINVTKFFRDKDAFDIINRIVLPDLFKDSRPGDLIKIWSVACSSGEEPYSLAMIVQEYLHAHKKLDVIVKIFATDVDDDALAIATQGIYPTSSLKDVTQERKNSFFVQEGSQYRVSSLLRKMVIFARHDITRDAPYSKVDLVICRNMLIYMNGILQNNVLQALHYAVKEKGYMVLGPSESPGVIKDSFKEVDRKWKIFKCINKAKAINRDRFDMPINFERNVLTPSVTGKHRNALNHIPEVFYKTVIEDDFAGIFIDKELTVKQAVGNFKDFLSFPETTFNFNLLKLVPVDLSMALSLAVRNAIKDDKKVVMKSVTVRDAGKIRAIDIIVKPFLDQHEYMQPFLFVVLTERDSPSKDNHIVVPANNEAAVTRIDDLERELQNTRQNLQALVEQIEAANEELQSSNEEMSASHEQLQSSNEELQSLNEELHTVSVEHQQKIKELNELNDDLANYFNNATSGQIFIDKRLTIRRFSPAVSKQINVKELDIGRSIMDLSTNFQDLEFINEIKRVMKTSRKLDRQIVMNDGKVHLMNIKPYIRRDKKVDGVIITFTDVSEIRSLSNFIEAIFDASPNAIIACAAIRDKMNKIVDFKYTAVNKRAGKFFKASVGKMVDHDFAGTQRDFKKLFAEVVEECKVIEIDFRTSSENWYQLTATKLEDGVLATLSDITDRRRAQDMAEKGYLDLQKVSDELKRSNHDLEKSNMDLMQFASIASHDLKEPLRKIQLYSDMLRTLGEGRMAPKESELFKKVIAASNRMKMLIDDVLTFSKLSNDEIPFENVDLNVIIHRIEDDLEVAIKEKSASLKVGKLPVIKGNTGQISQLFQNLVSNALKFNDKERPIVRIKEKALTRSQAREWNVDPTQFKVIEVSDNGIGFDNSFSDKIFAIFRRLHPSSKFDGTGIGLAICKKIIENHKGFIHAEGRPGKGATFYIGLPGSIT